MRTIGARLTLLYILAVAGGVASVLLSGRYLLERHLMRTLDSRLQSHYEQIKDRLGADTGQDDVRGLLAATGIGSELSVVVEDLWQDNDFRAARDAGLPHEPAPHLKFYSSQNPNGGDMRFAEGVNGSLRIRLSLPLVTIQEALRDYSRVGVVTALSVLFLSAVVGRLISRAALRPVRMIEHTAARITSDNLSERIPVAKVRDEISNLATLLNQTFDRLQSSFEQIERFSADASHELKTPLAIIRLNIERLLINEPLSPAGRVGLQEAIEQIDQLTRLIERLLFLSRAQAGEVQLNRVRRSTAQFLASLRQDAEVLCEARGVGFKVELNESRDAEFDEARIRQVLLNLLDNSLRASVPGTTIILHSSASPTDWTVTMEDSGCGLSAEDCERVFERFVRIPNGKRVGEEQAGLGLAICKSIIQLHGGSISARPNPSGRGLEVSFRIPNRA